MAAPYIAGLASHDAVAKIGTAPVDHSLNMLKRYAFRVHCVVKHFASAVAAPMVLGLTEARPKRAAPIGIYPAIAHLLPPVQRLGGRRGRLPAFGRGPSC